MLFLSQIFVSISMPPLDYWQILWNNECKCFSTHFFSLLLHPTPASAHFNSLYLLSHLCLHFIIASNILPVHNKHFRSSSLFSERTHNSRLDLHSPQSEPNCLLRLVNTLTPTQHKGSPVIKLSSCCCVIKPQAFMNLALHVCSFCFSLLFSSFIKS